MTLITHRSVLLGVALAALLVPLVVATGPSAGAAADPNCGVPTMFGLHGMAEGPSKANSPESTDSPEISDFDQAQNILSGAVGIEIVPYTTVYPDTWQALQALFKQGPLWASVQEGADNLQSMIFSAASGCPLSADKFFLVGYSEGGWVINVWLHEHTDEWSVIKGVVLFGDACRQGGGYQGLADIFTNTCGYSDAPFWTWTDCRWRDPICGSGWPDTTPQDHSAQLGAASRCNPSTSPQCPHLHYIDGAPSSGDIMEGARYLVQHLD